MYQPKKGDKVGWEWRNQTGEGIYVGQRSDGLYIIERIDGKGWDYFDTEDIALGCEAGKKYWAADSVSPLEPQEEWRKDIGKRVRGGGATGILRGKAKDGCYLIVRDDGGWEMTEMDKQLLTNPSDAPPIGTPNCYWINRYEVVGEAEGKITVFLPTPTEEGLEYTIKNNSNCEVTITQSITKPPQGRITKYMSNLYEQAKRLTLSDEEKAMRDLGYYNEKGEVTEKFIEEAVSREQKAIIEKHRADIIANATAVWKEAQKK